MSQALARAGVSCTVLELDLEGVMPRRRLEGDVEVFALPCLNRRFYIPRVSSASLRHYVRQADIVHLMGHWLPLNLLVARSAKRHRVPYVVCPGGALRVYGRSQRLKATYDLVGGRAMIQSAAAWIAITKAEVADFRAYGVDEQGVVVIPNGVGPLIGAEMGDQRFRAHFGLPNERLVLFMGRLHPIKGPDLLLRAFAAACEDGIKHHLVFAGRDEGMREQLAVEARSLGVAERVHIIGHIGGAEKEQAYRSADLLAIPSRHEAMSIVVLEAGVCSTPVLITDQSGFPEVGDAHGGLVVPSTVEGLRKGLARLLGDDNDLREMGRNLRDLVVRDYTWDALVGRLLQLYMGVLGESCRQ